MAELQIIDMFPSFRAFWEAAREKSVAEQLDDWAAVYMAAAPELLKKQLEDYAELGEDWLPWCQEHKGWLAGEFMRRVDAGEGIRPFFGSWYDLAGYKQTGYFLGHEVIKVLAAAMSLEEIALMENMSTMRSALSGAAGM